MGTALEHAYSAVDMQTGTLFEPHYMGTALEHPYSAVDMQTGTLFEPHSEF